MNKFVNFDKVCLITLIRHLEMESTLPMLYILSSVCVLLTPNAGQNMLFQCFLCKKLKKVVYIGRFAAFYVVLVPLEYIPSIPTHSSYVIDICFVPFKK